MTREVLERMSKDVDARFRKRINIKATKIARHAWGEMVDDAVSAGDLEIENVASIVAHRLAPGMTVSEVRTTLPSYDEETFTDHLLRLKFGEFQPVCQIAEKRFRWRDLIVQTNQQGDITGCFLSVQD